VGSTSRRHTENAAAVLASLMSKRSALSIIALVLVLVAVFWMRPHIARYNGVRLLLNLSPVLIFTALAQMFIMTASDIDLSIGSFVALVNVIVAGIASPGLVAAGLLACVVGYSLMGALIHWLRLPSIVVTLGASFVWLGLGLMVLPLPGGDVPSWLADSMRLRPPWIPAPVLVAIFAMLMGHLILYQTSSGVILRGVGSSPAALERAGRSTLRARVSLYALAGVCGVIAGVFLAGITTTGDANVGRGLTLLSIGAVIIGGGEFVGGIVSPVGTVMGALVMQLSGSLLSFASVAPAWQYSVQGGILVCILGLRAISWRRVVA
jgi:ribose/xylose/arabinose/galactoside ABC-type transport system permease subunit